MRTCILSAPIVRLSYLYARGVPALLFFLVLGGILLMPETALAASPIILARGGDGTVEGDTGGDGSATSFSILDYSGVEQASGKDGGAAVVRVPSNNGVTLGNGSGVIVSGGGGGAGTASGTGGAGGDAFFGIAGGATRFNIDIVNGLSFSIVGGGGGLGTTNVGGKGGDAALDLGTGILTTDTGNIEMKGGGPGPDADLTGAGGDVAVSLGGLRSGGTLTITAAYGAVNYSSKGGDVSFTSTGDVTSTGNMNLRSGNANTGNGGDLILNLGGNKLSSGGRLIILAYGSSESGGAGGSVSGSVGALEATGFIDVSAGSAKSATAGSSVALTGLKTMKSDSIVSIVAGHNLLGGGNGGDVDLGSSLIGIEAAGELYITSGKSLGTGKGGSAVVTVAGDVAAEALRVGSTADSTGSGDAGAAALKARTITVQGNVTVGVHAVAAPTSGKLATLEADILRVKTNDGTLTFSDANANSLVKVDIGTLDVVGVAATLAGTGNAAGDVRFGTLKLTALTANGGATWSGAAFDANTNSQSLGVDYSFSDLHVVGANNTAHFGSGGNYGLGPTGKLTFDISNVRNGQTALQSSTPIDFTGFNPDNLALIADAGSLDHLTAGNKITLSWVSP